MKKFNLMTEKSMTKANGGAALAVAGATAAFLGAASILGVGAGFASNSKNKDGK